MKISSKIGDTWSEGCTHIFINMYSYFRLREFFKSGFVEGRILIDGQLLVFLLGIIGVGSFKRSSFDMTSLAPKVFLHAEKNKQAVYFVGSTQEAISDAIDSILSVFPNLELVGFHHGFFEVESDQAAVINDICKKKPDLVVVGMGSPKQELFLLGLRNAGWRGTGFTCGGFFHQSRSNVNYYPKWADKFDLRWLYRIFDEPKLLFRYSIYYPLSVVLLVWDFKIRRRFS
ncbi:WecB/TagA/CpsF family glycosyltransferase [Microbulbifer sp. SSSA002]|uniref:WecB/TagA/CpsF family glycosyltransferase n=1 Tax=unclassified Microbulbifer TaxID=2619833 RepID=UPI0040399541